MKKILFTILLVIPLLVIGQSTKQKIITKLIIADATENGKNITEHILDQEAYLAIYTEDGTTLNMANIWKKNSTTSFGRIFDKKYHKTDKSTN